ncbi:MULTISPECIES: diaminopimelate epimerase [Clostridia]|uniref:Diaminopimelate epimerase n=1 Tax=Lacrimispora celerecrescens TaxID=29354 RepID=A0A084JPN3_9FIRM|nr:MULTISPECIES: diaminopimelate epimerase [Clostridia]KEZ90917.1 diaminopimelate epimerase [Lacrimispora celerecrescens]MBW4844868.1 diaminopimelate epimerase [Lachnospiraceae bacterium]MSS08357.1 diaminopimelate epimerase [Clostridium sp. WB02_MRS01]CUX64502.1 Diaminopimelate epimerase [Clostridium sp. C105KSO15]
MNITLEKYHGLGNDYLIFDPNKNELELTEESVRLICNRNFGVGSDGLLVGPILGQDKLELKILNPDGSEAELSGNGVRIFGKYLKDAGYVQKNRFIVNTLSGQQTIQYLNETGTRIKVSMGKLSFYSDEIPVTGPRREVLNETMMFGSIPYRVTCVTIGNPHCVIWLNDISKELACRIGKHSETADYFPEKINTELLKVVDRTNIEIEIYERGAGYTLASGTSGCAAAGAAYRMGLTDPKMYVHMPGGVLEVEIEPDGGVLMTGEVGYVGRFTLSHEMTEELRALR